MLQPDGASLRTHLQRAAAAGKVDPLLTAEPLPVCLKPLWELFIEISHTRVSGMAANAIAPTEIEAWCRMSGVELSPWEFATVLAIDAAILRTWAKQRAEKNETGNT